ncbi:MAG TPA: MraY family glycosyltransferase, partial [Deinococcales bacterium]|nr:MraY family glycosyltransferase [Deinococcales bacterium]
MVISGALFPLIFLAGTAFLVALCSVVLFIPHVREFALRIGAFQEGGSEHGGGRRIHSGKLPNIGGLGILGGFLLAVLVGFLIRPDLLDGMRVEVLSIVLGACLLALVGFMDDMWDLAPYMRLASQFVAAGILVLNGVRIEFITDFFSGQGYVFVPEALAVAVTVLWVVGFTNAFNFIDGLDGLSSGIAAISSMCLLAVALQFGDRGAAVLLLAALAGASLGFLRHNFSPAKIIMGDSGAYLIGYVLAATSVLGALKVTAAVTVAAPILVLALPVVNITQVTVRRLRRGANPVQASNDHLHDLIRVRSGSKNLTVLLLWSATLLLGILGMMLSATPPLLMYTTIAAAVTLTAAVVLLRLREVHRDQLHREQLPGG